MSLSTHMIRSFGPSRKVAVHARRSAERGCSVIRHVWSPLLEARHGLGWICSVLVGSSRVTLGSPQSTCEDGHHQYAYLSLALTLNERWFDMRSASIFRSSFRAQQAKSNRLQFYSGTKPLGFLALQPRKASCEAVNWPFKAAVTPTLVCQRSCIVCALFFAGPVWTNHRPGSSLLLFFSVSPLPLTDSFNTTGSPPCIV